MVYTTASKIQAELRATTAFSVSTNPTLASVDEWIVEITDYIDSLNGQSFESTPYTEYFDNNGSEDMYVKHTPIISITSVSENENVDGEVASYVVKTDEVDYVSYEESGVIKVNTNQWKPSSSKKKGVRVIYNAGNASVPGRVSMLTTKMVTERILSTLMNDNIESRNAGGSISVGSINIVEPGDYGVGTYKQLKSDIKGLQDEITTTNFRVHRYG